MATSGDSVSVTAGTRGLTIEVVRPSPSDYGQGAITLRGVDEVRQVLAELERFVYHWGDND